MLDRAGALLLRGLFALSALLPLDTASWLGGMLGRAIGPLFGAHRTARRNLARALPQLDAAEREHILTAMWDNLGRNAGEFPQQYRMAGARVELVGREHVEAMREDGQCGIFVSGHYGNWELLHLAWTTIGMQALVIYRAANNAAVDALFQEIRLRSSNRFAPKGKRAARDILAELRKGGHVAMLIDQKQNDGIAVPFLGRDAMTPPAVAEMALRYKCPILPLRCERIGGAHFRITAYPAFVPEATGDHHADLKACMTRINGILEGWIRERPDLWFWVHRRWPD
jgi:KDO2-lipid IV(A) lauroyltransferase